jgi:aspartyl-tRNA(Asn)/glutamyl-tRNA(Gln) amidotransferase subunit C
MSGFTAEDVRRLAALAQLELTTDEADAFAPQLSEILAFATDVQAVDLDSVPPAISVPGMTLVPQAPTRDDVVEPALDREAILGAAPAADRDAGMFKVPRVITG